MSFAIKPIVTPLLLPTGILLLSVMLLPLAVEIAPAQKLGLVQLPYYLLVLVASLGLLLSRTREAGAAMFLLIVYFCIQQELQSPLEQVRPGSVYFLLCLFVPVGIAILAVLPERKSLEFWGIASLLLAPVLLVIGMRVLDQTLAAGGTLNDIWVPRSGEPTILSDQAFYLFAVATLFCLSAFFVRRDTAQAGLLFSMVFTFATLNWLHLSMISTVMMLSAGIALFVGVMTSLLQMLYEDELTGLADRKALNKAMAGLREGDLLVMADIDKFKALNDTHGHDTGDEVLKLVAGLLGETRERAKAYRYGGEEFTLLFRGRDPDSALAALQEIRERIAAYPIHIRAREHRPKSTKKGAAYRSDKSDRKAIKTSISMGAVILRAGERPADALKRADKQLYKAKKAGRNCVCSDFR